NDLRRWIDDPSSGVQVHLGDLLPLPYLALNIEDWTLRKLGADPYLSNKTRLYDDTREVRQEMAATARAGDLQRAILDLPNYLDALWRDRRISAARRRRLLFQLWDECDDTDPGRQARAIILGFIRDHHIAYDVAELDQLNRRRTTRELFAP